MKTYVLKIVLKLFFTRSVSTLSSCNVYIHITQNIYNVNIYEQLTGLFFVFLHENLYNKICLLTNKIGNL